MSDPHNMEVSLVQIGSVPSDMLAYLRDEIGQAFGCRCIIGAALRISEAAYDYGRDQYSAAAILDRLPQGRHGHLLGIADVDLFVPELNFVFGLADINGRRAVVGLPRLRESFYGRRDNHELFRARALKEAVHELAHTYGLEHCMDPNCVMSFSNSLLDTDRKSRTFCARCAGKLRA